MTDEEFDRVYNDAFCAGAEQFRERVINSVILNLFQGDLIPFLLKKIMALPLQGRES